MRNAKSIAVIGVAVLAAVFFAAAMSTSEDEEVSPKVVREPDLFPFLKPLAGSAPERDVKNAAGDALIVNADLRRLFDRNLSATGESPDMMQAQIEHELSRRLKPGDIPPMELASTEKSVREMRSNGAGEEAIYRARAAALSVEAADRLAQLDQAEAAWTARTSAYLAERSRLLDVSATAAGTDQSSVLQQLRDSRFTVEEQQRLAAYESAGIPQLR